MKKILTMMRAPIFDSRKRFCLVCGTEFDTERKKGLFCNFQKHWCSSTDVISFFNLILKEWGIVFPLQTKTQRNFYKKRLMEMYEVVRKKRRAIINTAARENRFKTKLREAENE